MGLPWFKVAVSLARHPKLAQLEPYLPANEDPLAVVQRVWGWTAEFFPTGRFPKAAARDLPRHALRNGTITAGLAEKVMRGLLDARWLDEDGDFLIVHDWDEMQGAHIEAAEHNRKRQKALRDRRKAQKSNALSNGDSAVANNGEVTSLDVDRDKDQEKDLAASAQELESASDAGSVAPPVNTGLPAGGQQDLPGQRPKTEKPPKARRKREPSAKPGFAEVRAHFEKRKLERTGITYGSWGPADAAGTNKLLDRFTGDVQRCCAYIDTAFELADEQASKGDTFPAQNLTPAWLGGRGFEKFAELQRAKNRLRDGQGPRQPDGPRSTTPDADKTNAYLAQQAETARQAGEERARRGGKSPLVDLGATL